LSEHSAPPPDVPPAASPGRFLPHALLWLLFVAVAHTSECVRYFRAAAEVFPVPAAAFSAGGLAALWAGQVLRLAGVLLLFLDFWLAGRVALSALERRAGSAVRPVGRFLTEMAVGLCVFSFLGFLLALLGLSRPALLRGITLAWPAAVLLYGLRPAGLVPDGWRPRLGSLRRSAAEWGFSGGACLRAGPVPALLFLAAAGLYLLFSVVPETFADSLVYVLSLPEAYLRHGRLVDLPGNLIARYPGFVQTLYLWGLAWGDDRWCKLLNLGFGLLWAGAAGTWVSRRWNLRAGLWAAVFLFTSPFIGAYVMSCTYDALSGFFLFLAFAAWTDAWDGRPDGPRRLLVGASGFLLGAAGACKYTAAFALPFFALDFLWKCRAKGRFFWREALLFGLGGLLPLLPWWGRNLAYAGNPIFPYAADWLGRLAPEEKELLRRLGPEQRGLELFRDRLPALLRESLHGVRGGRFAFVGPVLLMALPLTVLVRRKDFRALVLPLAAFAAVSYVGFAASSSYLRYFMPALGLFFAWAGLAASAYADSLPRGGRAVRLILGAVVLTQLASVAAAFHVFYQGTPLLAGGLSEKDYLRRPHTWAYKNPSQGAYDHLASVGRPGDKVYILGETRTYRCPLPYYGNWLYDRPLFVRYHREGLPPEAWLARLRAEGFTHILLNPGEFTWAVVDDYRTPEWTARLNAFLAPAVPPVYRDEWTAVFEIPEAAGAKGKT
jgi:hypothetical protein